MQSRSVGLDQLGDVHDPVLWFANQRWGIGRDGGSRSETYCPLGHPVVVIRIRIKLFQSG